MIDEYMTLTDEDEEDNEDQAQERNNDEGEGGGGYHEEEGEEEEKLLLFQSIKNYNTKVFKEITSRNPSCISYRDDKGNTPLILATIVGWRKAIKILIRNGSDLDAQNHKGNTCCHYAFILPNYTDIQRYFYRKKANFTIVNEKNFNCKYQQLPLSASSPSLASGVGKGKSRE
jgi:ankyrin repeat protein